MRAQLRFAAAWGVILLASACITQQPIRLTTAVGPDPLLPAQPTAQGFLTVYTVLKTHYVERCYDDLNLPLGVNSDYWAPTQLWYRVHADYRLYDPRGHRLQTIHNEAAYHDPHPKVVALREGPYTIAGWGDGQELFNVPVLIKPGRLTVVNLDANPGQLFQGAPTSAVVRIPDGRIIGWSASPL